MKVLQVAPWVTVGGSDRATIDWIKSMRARGIAPYLVTTQESPNERFAEAQQAAIEAWHLPDLMPGQQMPGFILDVVRSRSIDVVHVMNSKLGFDILPDVRQHFPNLCTVVQLHAEEGNAGGYPPYSTRFDEVIDGYSVISQFLGRRLIEWGVDERKIHVIHLGIDLDEFDPNGPTVTLPGPGGLNVLYPHRIVDQKDPLLMVQVAAELRTLGVDAVVHVVGDGDMRSAVEEAVQEARLKERVLFHGVQDDMASWYRSVDVTLVTSWFEGIPLVCYEALACECPVVAAEVGGVSEVVDDQGGYLIKRRESPVAYAEALRQLADDPARRRALGREGRRRLLADFSIDRMAAGHERMYTALLDDRRRTVQDQSLVSQAVRLVRRLPLRQRRPGSGVVRPGTSWAPQGTRPIWLGESRGAAILTISDVAPAGLENPIIVGRCFAQPFPGTMPVTVSRPGLAIGSSGAADGYVLRTGLPGMVELRTAVATVLSTLPGNSHVAEPGLITGGEGAAWIDVAESPPVNAGGDRGASGAGR